MNKKDMNTRIAKKLLEMSIELLEKSHSSEEEPVKAYYRLKMLTDEIKALMLDKDIPLGTFPKKELANSMEEKQNTPKPKTEKPTLPKEIIEKEKRPTEKEEETTPVPQINERTEEKMEEKKGGSKKSRKNLNERMTDEQKPTLLEKIKTQKHQQTGAKLNEKFKKDFRSLQEKMSPESGFLLQEKVIIKNQFFKTNPENFESFFLEIMNASELGGIPVVVDKYAQVHNWSSEMKQELIEKINAYN